MFSATAEGPTFDGSLLDLSSKMDVFEGYDASHSRRLAALVGTIASSFNIAAHDAFLLQQAALVHDIGELDMEREYISAPRTLNPDERIDLHRHPVIGEQATSKLALPRAVQLIVRWHHEWWNGAGYPDGLEGDQIPLAARILRAADTYASLVSPRPFRAAVSTDDALKYMIEWAGIEFDPAVVKALIASLSSR